MTDFVSKPNQQMQPANRSSKRLNQKQNHHQQNNSNSNIINNNNNNNHLNLDPIIGLGSNEMHSTTIVSKPMIVNSHPYNPSQQRCVDLQQEQQALESNRMQQQQRNALYGSSALTSQQSQHMLDLANLQQNMVFSNSNHQQDFNSTAANVNKPTGGAGENIRTQNNKRFNGNTADDNFTHHHRQTTIQQHHQQQQNDHSLYSPSSSTSLLYHIYDQINLPSEQQQYQQQTAVTPPQQHDSGILLGGGGSSSSTNGSATSATEQSNGGLSKKNNTTTILNPANLFGATNHLENAGSGAPIVHPLSMQMHLQQQQLNSANNNNNDYHRQQQHCYSGQNPFLFQQQQQPFNTIHHPSAYQQQQQSGLMLDAVIRQHALANTLARPHHNNNNNNHHHHHHQRPLSSSGGSSMASNQSSAVPVIGYGRHPRQPTKSSLSSVLQQSSNHNTLGQLNHLAIMGSSPTLNTLGSSIKAASLDSRGGVGGRRHPISTTATASSLFNDTTFKRVHQRLRHLLYEYRTIVKCSILLVLLAFSLMSIIKFTLLSASTTPSLPHHQQASGSISSSAQVKATLHPNFIDQNSNHHLLHQHNQGNNNNNPHNNINSMFPFSRDQATQMGHQPNAPIIIPFDSSSTSSDSPFADSTSEESQSNGQQQLQQDYLRSKWLKGEFAIVSQNYSNSASQKSLLEERVEKLMDQVFLATDMRRVYSRLVVTNIRPNKPNGIIVDCDIILSESISYAAQQFGKALFDSLAMSHDRLANQVNYIIDKNSIKFNSVPDKDIKSGMFPSALMPPSVSREFAFGQTGQDALMAPSSGPFGPAIVEPSSISSTPTNGLLDTASSSSSEQQQANLVVWSEWSQWSSCVGKNGVCDPTRLHSRIRKCVAQNTGEKLEPSECKQRFNPQDQELEVTDCSRSCSQQQQQQQQRNNNNNDDNNQAHLMMSESPLSLLGLGPQTAPSVMLANDQNSGQNLGPAGFLHSQPKMSAQTALPSGGSIPNSQLNQAGNNLKELSNVGSLEPTPPASAILSTTTTTERSQLSTDSANNSPSTPTLMPLLSVEQPQAPLSCSNCTSDEICLLLMSQKVPFCAKIKDRADESGCGGWCKASNQLCQPVGKNAFKCIHDSECLADEWRCHDSACIPLSKRCDGHSNCYDSSDERDCPII